MEGPKKYLYHAVSDSIEGSTLYPLNRLKESADPKLREIAQKVSEKYLGREFIPETVIPTLGCKWGDVLQLSPIHPHDLKKAIIDAGLQPHEMKFYQIDPESLDPKLTTVYLYNDENDDSPEAYASFDKEKLKEHSVISPDTINYYQSHREQYGAGKLPLLFVKVPHVFYKGSIDVSNLSVITVDTTPESDANKIESGSNSI